MKRVQGALDPWRAQLNKIVRPDLSPLLIMNKKLNCILRVQLGRNGSYRGVNRTQFCRDVGEHHHRLPFSVCCLLIGQNPSLEPHLFGTAFRETVGLLPELPDGDARHDRCQYPPERDNKGSESDDQRHNSHCNRPTFPPNDAVRLAKRRASAKPIPPAHSLIPLWTGRHSAMPWRAESCHG